MEVAAALLDASRKLTEKDVSTGNVSTTSGSSWTSSNTEVRHCHTVCLSRTDHSVSAGGGADGEHSADLLVLQHLGGGWAEKEVDMEAEVILCSPLPLRALSETVSSSEKQATMSWLGVLPAGQRQGQDCHTININIPQTNSRTRRASCKGIETAMAGGLGKVWYDS